MRNVELCMVAPLANLRSQEVTTCPPNVKKRKTKTRAVLCHATLVHEFFWVPTTIKSKYFSDVIHSVGPMDEDPQLLQSCYQTCLDLVDKHQIKTIAFCGISTVFWKKRIFFFYNFFFYKKIINKKKGNFRVPVISSNENSSSHRERVVRSSRTQKQSTNISRFFFYFYFILFIYFISLFYSFYFIFYSFFFNKKKMVFILTPGLFGFL